MSRSFLLFGFILYSVFLSSLANASDIDLSAPMDKGGWKLIWSEEFDYTGFPDSTKWSYDTEGNVYQWGNNEAQYYTSGRKENAWVSDGVLRITALKEPMEGRSYTSARLITKGKGDWLYGRFEIRAKLRLDEDMAGHLDASNGLGIRGLAKKRGNRYYGKCGL